MVRSMMAFSSQEIEIRGVQILLNSAKRFDGGGIHMASIERINIHDANFSQNAAGSNGGGMALLLFQVLSRSRLLTIVFRRRARLTF